MTPVPAPREAVIGLLLAAGFTQHTPPSRRKHDPAPADGFRAFDVDPAGTVLVAWVPVGGGDHKKPAHLAKSREMAGQYADAARAAGLAAEFGGLIWPQVLITSQRPA
jgi:hypothetical protein